MSDVVVIELADIQEGIIIAEDVYLNTASPIMRKDTLVRDEHLSVLRTFAIPEVKVLARSIEGDLQVTTAQGDEDTENLQEVKEPTLQEQYIEVVQQFKREFIKWRSGVSPDVAEIRAMISPLIKQLKKPETDLAFLTTVATKDDYFYHHSIAVGLLAAAIGKKMALSTGEVIQLGIAGTLIDCGMAKIDAHVINKVGRLTTKEYNEVKKHPIYSYQMIQDSRLLRTEMKLAILQHHERLDGSGYPRREKGKRITIYAQILGAADVYHARTSDRIYRSKESPYKVLESFKATYEEFSFQVINGLYSVAGRLSIGTRVKLSNNEIGRIVYLHQAESFRPVVKLEATDKIVDLTKLRNITIKEML